MTGAGAVGIDRNIKQREDQIVAPQSLFPFLKA